MKTIDERKQEWIDQCSEIHNNKYDYSKVEYVNWKTPVVIICPEHGEFTMRPTNHQQGKGCRLCNRKKKTSTKEKVSVVNDVDKRKQDFIDRANRIHNNKYDYSKVDYQTQRIPVTIVCPIHGEFIQRPTNHINRGGKPQGCPECGKEYSLKYSIENFTKHTYENVLKKALLCKTKKDFNKKYPSEYQVSYKKGWLLDYTHFKQIGNRKLRMVYKYSFKDGSFYYGLTYDMDNRNECHMKDEDSSVYQHLQKVGGVVCLEFLTDYIDMELASLLERGLTLKHMGDPKLLNKVIGGTLGFNSTKYEFNDVIEQVIQYSTIDEWKDGDRDMYNYVRGRGLDFFQQVCDECEIDIPIKKSYDEIKMEVGNYIVVNKINYLKELIPKKTYYRFVVKNNLTQYYGLIKYDNKRARRFSDDEVRTIRQLHKDGMSYNKIAKRYGVNHPAIRKICVGIRYKDVE